MSRCSPCSMMMRMKMKKSMEVEPDRSAAQRGPRCSKSRGPEDSGGRGRRTERGQLLHSVVSFHSFLCLFTHLLPGCAFLATSLVFKEHTFISECKSLIYLYKTRLWLSLSRRGLGLLAVQGEDGAIELFDEVVSGTSAAT